MRITHGTPDFGVDVAKEGLQVSVTQSTDQAIGEAPFLRSPEEKIPPDDENFNSLYQKKIGFRFQILPFLLKTAAFMAQYIGGELIAKQTNQQEAP